MKIRSRFLLFLLSFYFLILTLGITVQVLSYRIFSSYLYGSVSEIFNASVGSFVNAVDNAEQLSISIIADEDIQNFLKHNVTGERDFSWNRERVSMLDSLSFYMRTNPYVKEIIVFDTEDSPYYTNIGAYNSVQTSSDIIESNIGTQVDLLGGKAFWGETASSPFPVVLARLINVIGEFNRPPLGKLFIFIDIDKLLADTLTQIDFFGLQTTIRYNNKSFYSVAGSEMSSIRNSLGSKRYDTVQYQGSRHFAAVIATSDAKWEFLFLIPARELFKDLNLINRIIYVIYIAIFIIFALLIIRSSKKITAPIIALSREMKVIDEKEFVSSEPLPLPERVSDEVTSLYYEFYQMISKIDTLVNKNLKQELVLNQSQLKALSNQLNPHFLYNTLDSLYWMAEINNQPEMAALIKSLSSLLRSSLNKAGPLITVKEQLDLLNDYLYIQKIRFKERLDYQIEVDHQLYDAEIPRFTLQPLIENSIKYTLESNNNQCLVEVSIKREPEDNSLVICIRDNGPGLNTSDREPQGTGIGIANLKQRISLLYGEKGTLETVTNNLGGTDVVIYLPDLSDSKKQS